MIFPQRILYEQGEQTLYFVPVDQEGRPSVVTTPFATIKDLRKAVGSTGRAVLARAAVTVATATETLTAAAGPATADARKLTVASTTGFTAGRTYLLTKADGQREAFVVDRVSTDAAIYTRESLESDYAIGDTLRGLEMPAAFPSAEASEQGDFEDGGGPYQVLWEYTIDGQLYLVPEVVWTVRYSVVPLINAADVRAAYPTLSDRVGDRFQISRAVVMAAQDYAGDLQAAGMSEIYMQSGLAGKKAQRCKAIEWVLRWLRDHEDADRWEERYDRIMGSLTTGRPPETTVQVSHVNDDAPAGSDQGYGMPLIRRS